MRFLFVRAYVRPTGNQEVAGSIPAGSGNILLEIDHEILSESFSPSADQEGQL